MGNGALDDRLDTRDTETFLQTQEGVIDASVWYQHGQLMANLVVRREAVVDVQRLMERCARDLGEPRTPRIVRVMRDNPR
jgi:hypothetical protein